VLSRHNLHNYQIRALSFIKAQQRCGLFLDMGLGKTSTTLTAISDLIEDGKVKKVLVIAPLRVANSVWHTEAKKWNHLKHLRFSICTGSMKERMEALRAKADVYVINRENVYWLVEICNKLGGWPFKMVVVDESSSFKNPSSKRFRALKKASPVTDYMVLLTGTPSPNGLMDLWSQHFLIDFGKALGRTITGFRERFFIKDYFGHSYTIKTGAEESIHALLEPTTMSMAAADYLELPDRVDVIEWVDHSEQFMQDYEHFEKNLFATLPDGEEVEALTASALATKLLQWCNGATYTQDGQWSHLSDAKLDALEELAESDENLLVAYNFKFDLVNLQKRFPNAVVLGKDPKVIDQWNAGKIKMLLAHPASASMGLNLQQGGNVIVWYGLTWALENYLQFNARLHRQGQGKPVRIVHLVARGCLDERVIDVLGQKDATQKSLLKALRK
jgi:SNF2 family DNA or RNA helicase